MFSNRSMRLTCLPFVTKCTLSPIFFSSAAIAKIKSAYKLQIPGISNVIEVPRQNSFLELKTSIEKYSEEQIIFKTLRGSKIASTTRLSNFETDPFFLNIGERKYKLLLQKKTTHRAEDYYFDYMTSIGIPPNQASLVAQYIEKMQEKLKTIKLKDRNPKIKYQELEEAIHKALRYFGQFQKCCEIDTASKAQQQEKANERNLAHSSLYKTLIQKQQDLAKLNQLKSKLDIKAEKKANRLVYCGLSILVAELGFISTGTFYYFCWDIMEPVSYLMGVLNTFAGFSVFAIKNMELNAQSLNQAFKNRFARRLYKKKGLDLEAYSKLDGEVKALRALIQKI